MPSGYTVAAGDGAIAIGGDNNYDDDDGGCASTTIVVVDDSFVDEDVVDGGGNLPQPPSMSRRTSVRVKMMQRHDSMFSVDDNYHDPSPNDLSVWQGAALLTADCLGTGLLALPEDVKVLGRWIGLGFLILNMPINLYAGTILSDSAAHVERTQTEENEIFERRQQQVLQQQLDRAGSGAGAGAVEEASSKDGLMMESPKKNRGKNRGKHYSSLEQTDHDHENEVVMAAATAGEDNNNNNTPSDEAVMVDGTPQSPCSAVTNDDEVNPHNTTTVHHDTATFDFVGMTQALFSSRRITRWVMALFYVNIFLVLGDYILVMSHAVSALVGEEVLCIPQAGILASILMYAVSQIRTMAKLGRAATVISLSSLFVVVVQCLWAVHMNKSDVYVEASSSDFDTQVSLLTKLSALGSIGFAMGSQKLFLNIRHELKERNKAPNCLAMSLSVFVTVYVGIILLAGSDPPGFLFDAIPPGWNRRIAGLLLWIHVAVSYSINSQAICASMDRLFFSNIELWGLNNKPKLRWLCLTAIMSVMAFVVANAVPFFKDLVALIGALTSIPLSLHLPAIFFRRYLRVPICWPTRQTLGSYGLLVFASAFMVAALAGSISSIELDWSSHGGSFACHG